MAASRCSQQTAAGTTTNPGGSESPRNCSTLIGASLDGDIGAVGRSASRSWLLSSTRSGETHFEGITYLNLGRVVAGTRDDRRRRCEAAVKAIELLEVEFRRSGSRDGSSHRRMGVLCTLGDREGVARTGRARHAKQMKQSARTSSRKQPRWRPATDGYASAPGLPCRTPSDWPTIGHWVVRQDRANSGLRRHSTRRLGDRRTTLERRGFQTSRPRSSWAQGVHVLASARPCSPSRGDRGRRSDAIEAARAAGHGQSAELWVAYATPSGLSAIGLDGLGSIHSVTADSGTLGIDSAWRTSCASASTTWRR